MNLIRFPFMLLAAVGLLLSIGVHVAALLGIQIPGGDTVWGLHMGVFVVWIPTGHMAISTKGYDNSQDFWKVALAGSPIWMRRALYGLIAYAVVNFFIVVMFMGEKQSTGGGTSAAELRAFSDVWMVFYGAAFALLYSAIHAPPSLRERRCSRGHVVLPTARFCPECGVQLPKLSSDASQETLSK